MNQIESTETEPAVAQIWEQTLNGTFYQIIYVDEQIVLLRDDSSRRNGENGHRIERRTHFDACIKSGQFKHRPDSDLDLIEFESRDWSKVDYIGEKIAENLKNAGYETSLDVQQADDDELLSIDGLGEAGVRNLRSFAR